MSTPGTLSAQPSAARGAADNKVLVIGPKFAGKTCIFDVFAGKPFTATYRPSTAVDFHKLKVNMADGAEPVVLKVWEACGQDRLVNTLAPHFYRLAGYCLVVADVLSVLQGADDAATQQLGDEAKGQRLVKMLSNPSHPRVADPTKAFASAIQWKNKAKQQVPGIPCLLLINKVDLLPTKKKAVQAAGDLPPGVSAEAAAGMTDRDLDVLAQMPFTHDALAAMCEVEGFVGYQFTSAKTGQGIEPSLHKAAAFFCGGAADPRSGRGSVDTGGQPPTAVTFGKVQPVGSLAKPPAEKKKQAQCAMCS